MTIVPITRELFGKKRFKRNATFHFAGEDSFAPLALGEVTRAMLHLPIGFAKDQEEWTPVALQGLSEKKNLFVLPNGRWVGRYMPLCYRLKPFVLVSREGNQSEGNQLVLCFDDDSELLSDNEGEPFFDEQQNPSEIVTGIFKFLGKHAQNVSATRRLCGVLKEHGLLTEWQITLREQETAKQATLSGLFRIDEEAFNKLDPNTLAAVHQAGALPLIYCQLLSMQNLAVLSTISKEHASAKKRAAERKRELTEEPGMTFTADDTIISFEGL